MYLSRLHPVFNIALLEPYHDPSLFHPHASPAPFQLGDDPALSIKSILDCRKIGHRYEYFVQWKNQPDSENSWIPLSDISTTDNELLERFHRRHPRAPRPHPLLLTKSVPPVEDDSVPVSTSTPIVDFDIRALPRPRSPVPEPVPAHYTPLSQTTTRTGRISRPVARYDPPIR